MWNKLFSKNKSSSSASTTTLESTLKKTKKKNKLSNVLSNLSIRKSDKNHEIFAFIENSTKENNISQLHKTIGEFPANKDNGNGTVGPPTISGHSIKDGSGTTSSPTQPEVISPDAINFHPCPICSRTFNSTTYMKHVSICQKMATKKRKTFDSSRQRWEGTDIAILPPKPEHLKITQPKSTVLPRKSIDLQQSAPLVHKEKSKSPSPLARATTQIQQTHHPALTEKRSSLPSVVKRSLAAVTDQCPHCERCFGVKAYDRHVEWCKEKSRFGQHGPNSSSTLNVAKERLQARTQYRAPPLKTKRGMNREKYSGFGDQDSNHGLSESSSPMYKSLTIGLPDLERKQRQNSMTSSTTSEGALSDNYDPFLSAKRQLEELFSPTNTSTPTTAITKSKNIHTPINTSFNAMKSNFKRTSSLRLPKTTSTLKTNNLFTNRRPSIQRGISIDDGPISTSFLKSTEYDEMPVKSACVNPSSRALLPKTYPAPVMRDPSTVLRRKDLKLDLKLPNQSGDRINDLSKTDSLAIFLKYENELCTTANMSEKDIKDKNNSFNKRLSTISTDTSDHSPSPSASARSPYISSADNVKTDASHFVYPSSKNDSNYIDPKLINLCDNLPITITKLLSDSDTTTSTDSAETTATSHKNTDMIQNYLNNNNSSTSINNNNTIESSSNRNSAGTVDSRRLKRQLKLSKDNFLYDTDIFSDQCDQQIEQSNESQDYFKELKKSSTDKLFENFDLDDFISSFEDDEKYPIFKDYKEIMLKSNPSETFRQSRERSLENDRKHSQTSNVSDADGKQNYPLDDANELKLLIKEIAASNSEDCQKSSAEAGQVLEPKYEQVLNIAEKELMESVQDLENYGDISPKTYPADSDEISSVESFPTNSNKTTGSKFSADSAYGSLSRQSPVEQTRPIRRNAQRTRQQQQQQPSSHQTTLTQMPYIDRPQKQHSTKNHDTLVLSSSESETSLPPISTQKMEIFSHNQRANNNNTNSSSTSSTLVNPSASTSPLDFRMSKFCHECGFKFVLPTAKFCMECGVKRILLE